VASSHDSGIREIEFIAAGSRSHNIFEFFQILKDFSLIKLAAFQTSGGAET